MIRAARTAAVLCGGIPCAVVLLACVTILRAADTSEQGGTRELARQIFDATGVRGGLIVHQTRLQQRDFASCSPTIGYGGTSAAWHHALFSIGGVSFYSSIFCTLGGIATPTARKTAAVVSARSLRRRNRFP